MLSSKLANHVSPCYAGLLLTNYAKVPLGTLCALSTLRHIKTAGKFLMNQTKVPAACPRCYGVSETSLTSHVLNRQTVSVS